MKSMKHIASTLLALVMVLALTVPAFAAETTTLSVDADDARTYEVYQIFTGDLAENGATLSNVKWGKNGTGTEGEAVAQSVLDALTAVTSNNSDVAKLVVIESYVNLDSAAIGTLSADAPLTVTTGYYLLKDVTEDLPEKAERSTFVVEIVGPTEIAPKAGEVTSEKKVKDTNDSVADSTSDWQDSADYDIGDAVPFQLKATLTEKYDHYDSYYLAFHDTLSDGLEFDGADSVKVYVDGVKITSGFEVVTTGLTDGCTIEVQFADLKDIASVKASSVITVEYTATLTNDAVIGSTGNTNTMHVEYSNDPNWDGDGDEPTGETPDDTVVVFTYKVVANKVTKGEDGNMVALKGAGFTLYKWSVEENDWVAIGDEVKGTDMTTFTWTGLDDGKYKLEETTTPDGYNTIADIVFTITAEHTETGSTITVDNTEFTPDNAAGSVSTQVVNNAGAVLPETGGMGTTIFYALGAMLMVGAAVLLITKKRMSVEK